MYDSMYVTGQNEKHERRTTHSTGRKTEVGRLVFIAIPVSSGKFDEANVS